MNKTFIFDLDGVLIDDETMWLHAKKEFFPKIVGEGVYEKMGSLIGLSIDAMYEIAKEYGTKTSREDFFEEFNKRQDSIYHTAPITKGLQSLSSELTKLHFQLGLVSNSPRKYIDIVLKRIPDLNFSYILSLHDQTDLAHKPAPDGYLEAIKKLSAQPNSTIILEDSNNGILSAKASGAFTIGLKQNLTVGYIQKGADIYADDLEDVIKILRRF